MSKQSNFSKGFYNWGSLLIIGIAVVMLNIISSFKYGRFDMTEDQRYSLSEGTIEFLSNENNFKNKIVLKIYLDGNLPSEIKHFRNAVEDKLKEFKQVAGDRIQYQFIDPQQGTELEQQELFDEIYSQGKGILPMDIVYQKDGSQSQMMLWPGAIINYAGVTTNSIQLLPGTTPGKPYRLDGVAQMIQNSINNLEYILVSSIRKTVQTEQQKVGFLQGHGELRMAETQRARALISPYFGVEDVVINEQIDALDNFDGLIIARPQARLSEKDLFVIDQFVMRGGRLMCFLDALHLDEDTLNAKGSTHSTRVQTGLERLLFDYGLKINDNFVLDSRCAPKIVPFAKQSLLPWFYHVLATPTDHPISRSLAPVSLKYTNEIQFIEYEKVSLSPILTSSTNSTVTGLAPMVSLGLPLNYGNNPELVPDPKNEDNKRCLAGLSEGFYTSSFKNRIIDDYAANPNAKFIKESNKEGKVMLVGNGRFIQNSYDSMPNKMSGQMMYRPTEVNDLRFDKELAQNQIEIYFGNQEFFQNMVDYVMGDNSVLNLRKHQINIQEIDNAKVKQDSGFYKVINMLLPSFLVVIFALIMSLIRKRRYAKSIK